MSRSRKDDSRYQSPAGPGLQSSPSRDPHSGAGAFHSPVVSGHNYMRSKVKDKDRSGYLSKDRGVKSANAVDPNERYFAQARQGNFQSPPPNSFSSVDGAASARELSWADEVELSMSNNISQRTDANAGPGSTPQKMMKPLEHGQLMKSQEHGMAESKSTMQSGDANQRPGDEKVQKMPSKNTVVQPAAAFSNGKAKVNFDKEHDTASFKRANCPQLRRGSRKKTLSLNPEEREALESLIEEVLMDGVIDSESASSEEETEQSETWKNAALGGAGINASAGGDGLQRARGDKGKMGRKYYPGQLKVALKHMTELPPRFSRKLKKAEKYLELNTMRTVNSTTGRIEEEDEENVALAREEKRMSLSPHPPERDKEKAKSKEHQVKEFKRSIRTLLTDLDQYVDEKSVLSGSSSATSIHPPGAIICEDLERESLSLRQPLQGSDPTHEVPSTVQNLLLAAKGYTSAAGNQAGATQDTYQEQYQENESGSNLGGYPGQELASQRGYTGSYTVPYSTAGSQFVVNVPEFVPKGMIVTPYQQQEMLSPAEHRHQYPASLMTQLSPGSMSGNLNDSCSRHGLTADQMMAMGQGCSLANASSTPSESMSSGMMDFSNSLVSLPPAMGTQGSSMGEKMLSQMPPVFVSSGMPLSNLPSPGSLPFYQYQSQNPPPPSSSYSFPVQVPFSSNQYCYMPPALPPQSLPPPYYPRDQQVQYADGGMQFKAMVPDWGYQKSKHYSSNVSTLPTYSAFSNQMTVPPSYPGNEQGMPGMNNPNFRQRKKQPGLSVSPRNAANVSSNMLAGKLAMQRTRGNEVPSASTRVGVRPGQENADFYPHPETSMTVPAYGDASLKRFPFTVRSRVSGDGQLGYPGRRENRNFVSEKYAIPRTFTGDGKKETRHVTLKPKQSKPNRSLTRPRNDPNVAPLHPLKAHHPSDLSEEGLESPDNFGDVESGADDWSTDNYDQEVSKRGKQESVENRGDLTDLHNAKGENVIPSMILPCPVEEIQATQPVEMTPSMMPDEIYVSENGLVVFSSSCVAEALAAEITFQVDDVVPMCSPEPDVGETARGVSKTGSTADIVQHSTLEMQSEEICVALVTENSQPQLDVDRYVLHTENIKRTAVRKKFQVLLEDLQFVADVPSVHPSSPLGRMAELNAERDYPSARLCSGNDICESLTELSVVVGSEEAASRADILAEYGLADIDVPDVAVDEEEGFGSGSKGMDVMLGINFISRLANMFNPGQSADSLRENSLKTQVHLSQAVLNQIYLEYITQDQNPSNLQNVVSGSLEEDVSHGPLVDVRPERDHLTVSPSIDEKTSDAQTGCSMQQQPQQQLCDTSYCRESDSNDCKSVDVVLSTGSLSENDVVLGNNVGSPLEDVVLHNNSIGSPSEDIVLGITTVGSPLGDVVLNNDSVGSPTEDVVLNSTSIGSPSEDVVLSNISVDSRSEDVVLSNNTVGSPLEDVVLDNNSIGSPSVDVVLSNNAIGSPLEDVVLENNSIGSPSEDVVLSNNAVGNPFEDVVLENNSIGSPSEDAVLSNNTVGNPLEDVVLENNSIGSPAEDVVLSNNTVGSPLEDVVLENNSIGSLSEDVVLSNNTVGSPLEDVVLDNNSIGSPSEDVVLSNNTVGNPLEDVVLDNNSIGSPSEDVILSNNTVGNPLEDVVLDNNSIGSPSEDVVLSNNTVGSPLDDVVLDNNSIGSPSEDVVLSNNTVGSPLEDVVLNNNRVGSASGDVVLNSASIGSPSEDVVFGINTVGSPSEDVVLSNNSIDSRSEDIVLGNNTVGSLSEDVVLNNNTVDSRSEDVHLHNTSVGSPSTAPADGL